MPGIVERTPYQCFQAFKAILDPVLGCLPHSGMGLKILDVIDEFGTLGFDENRFVRFKSKQHGYVWLRVLHELQAEKVSQHEYWLKTLEYRYEVQISPSADQESVRKARWRWEYEKNPQDPNYRYCRNHVHWDHGDDQHFHIPTGWTSVEDIVRFVIADLKVPSPVSTWHEVLKRSHEDMRSELFPQRTVSEDPVQDALILCGAMSSEQLQQFKIRLKGGVRSIPDV